MPAKKQQIVGLMMAFRRRLSEGVRRSGEGSLHTMPKVVTLLYVKTHGPTMKSLATYLSIRASSVTALVLSMEVAGLLKRVRDEKDRRSYHLHLTKKGESFLKKSLKILEDSMEGVLKSLSSKEQQTFIDLLKKITTV